jgi:phosphatidylethanolamine/phosphatidyl-N-methylethanolamine N-methyltransferase
MRRTLNNCKLFFSQFLSGENVGSVAPSGKSLATKMVQGVDFENANTIVELGPGTGAITKYIIPRMKPGSQLISIELNAKFVAQLKQDFAQENVHFVEDSVENLLSILDLFKVDKVDAYISSMPISILPKKMTTELTQNMINTLSDDGVYTQYQYSLHKRKWIEANWTIKSKAISFLNVPPGIVYTCKKKS